MKNLIFTCFALATSLMFAQTTTFNDLYIDKEKNDFEFLMSTIKEDAKTLKFQKIIPLEIKFATGTSEAKFSSNEVEKNIVNNIKNDAYQINDYKVYKNASSTNNTLTYENHKKLIYDLIVKKMLEQNTELQFVLNNAEESGIVNTDLYRSFSNMYDKLNVTFKTPSDVEIQIGKNILPHMNKILKSEIDKTLQNSLNLLVINF